MIVARTGLRGAIRLRVVTEVDFGERIDSPLRYTIAREGIAHDASAHRARGQRIVDHHRQAGIYQALREVALPFKRGRYARGNRIAARAAPRAFVVEEEESPVTAVIQFRNTNRSAQAAAEDVIVKHAFLPSETVRAPVIGVQFVVAQKLVGRAMELVAAGAGDHGDCAAG